MARFDIKQVNPLKEKDKIFDFWKKYLPESSEERFFWMQEGNPAGPAVWFFAYDNKTQEIAGMISAIPRYITHKGQQYKGGMLGDFMIGDKYRVFGPAIPLHKYLLTAYKDAGFDFLYTIPEQNLVKFFQGLKYTSIGNMTHLCKIIRTHKFIARKLPPIASRVASFILDLLLFLFLPERLSSPRLACSISDTPTLPQDVKINNCNVVTGASTQAYLKWRYKSNPSYVYKYCSVISDTNSLKALLVFTEEPDKIAIKEAIYFGNTTPKKVIPRAVFYLVQKYHKNIYFRCLQNSEEFAVLNKNFFKDAKDDVHFFQYGATELFSSPWKLFWGEKFL